MRIVKPWRSEKYLKWVRTLPSVISGYPADVAHHLIGHGNGGTGTKVTDIWTFPLTSEEHTDSNHAIHHMGVPKWEEEYGCQWKFVSLTVQLAILEGAVSIPKGKISHEYGAYYK